MVHKPTDQSSRQLQHVGNITHNKHSCLRQETAAVLAAVLPFWGADQARAQKLVYITQRTCPGQLIVSLRSSVGQSEGLLIPRSSVRARSQAIRFRHTRLDFGLVAIV